jgi:hypothetical protein
MRYFEIVTFHGVDVGGRIRTSNPGNVDSLDCDLSSSQSLFTDQTFSERQVTHSVNIGRQPQLRQLPQSQTRQVAVIPDLPLWCTVNHVRSIDKLYPIDVEMITRVEYTTLL